MPAIGFTDGEQWYYCSPFGSYLEWRRGDTATAKAFFTSHLMREPGVAFSPVGDVVSCTRVWAGNRWVAGTIFATFREQETDKSLEEADAEVSADVAPDNQLTTGVFIADYTYSLRAVFSDVDGSGGGGGTGGG